jgi:hypothetical protein
MSRRTYPDWDPRSLRHTGGIAGVNDPRTCGERLHVAGDPGGTQTTGRRVLRIRARNPARGPPGVEAKPLGNPLRRAAWKARSVRPSGPIRRRYPRFDRCDPVAKPGPGARIRPDADWLRLGYCARIIVESSTTSIRACVDSIMRGRDRSMSADVDRVAGRQQIGRILCEDLDPAPTRCRMRGSP